jgi:hypothetical protein
LILPAGSNFRLWIFRLTRLFNASVHQNTSFHERERPIQFRFS